MTLTSSLLANPSFERDHISDYGDKTFDINTYWKVATNRILNSSIFLEYIEPCSLLYKEKVPFSEDIYYEFKRKPDNAFKETINMYHKKHYLKSNFNTQLFEMFQRGLIMGKMDDKINETNQNLIEIYNDYKETASLIYNYVTNGKTSIALLLLFSELNLEENNVNFDNHRIYIKERDNFVDIINSNNPEKMIFVQMKEDGGFHSFVSIRYQNAWLLLDSLYGEILKVENTTDLCNIEEYGGRAQLLIMK